MRILIADSQEKVRYALSVLLTERLKWLIVREAGDASELLTILPEIQLDVLLLDYHLPGMEFPELITTIHTIKKDVIILCMSPNPDLRQYVQAQGVDYFISKVDSPNKLIKAFRDCEMRMASPPVTHEY